jgi:hypothetical protein
LSFISNSEKSNKSGELENAMIQAIKKQAKAKNYSWE